jgi:hypothetical protein
MASQELYETMRLIEDVLGIEPVKPNGRAHDEKQQAKAKEAGGAGGVHGDPQRQPDDDDKAAPSPTLKNVVRILANDQSFKNLIWYDDFLCRPITGCPAREWTDADDLEPGVSGQFLVVLKLMLRRFAGSESSVLLRGFIGSRKEKPGGRCQRRKLETSRPVDTCHRHGVSRSSATSTRSVLLITAGLNALSR